MTNEKALLKCNNQLLVKKNQTNWRKIEKTTYATFYKLAYNWITKIFVPLRDPVSERLNFTISKCIYFVLCNFSLKSYLWFQTKVHSTQFNYHYKSVKNAQKIISTLRCQNREESQLKSKFTANNTFCLIKFVHYFFNLDKKKQNDFTRYFFFRYCGL